MAGRTTSRSLAVSAAAGQGTAYGELSAFTDAFWFAQSTWTNRLPESVAWKQVQSLFRKVAAVGALYAAG